MANLSTPLKNLTTILRNSGVGGAWLRK